MESTFQPPNVKKISQAFNFGEVQETILSLLMKSDGFQINEEFCRSKLKSIKPSFISNFPQHLKTMEQKGAILVGYKPDGIKFIKMTPLEKLNEMLADSTPASKFKPRSPRLTQQEIDSIREDIVFFIKETPGITKETLFDKVVKKYSYISSAQFQSIFCKLSSSKLLSSMRMNKGKFMYSLRDPSKDSKSENDPISFNKGRLTIALDSKDIEGFRTALRKLSFTEDPAHWIKNKAEDIIIRILSQQMPLDDITLDVDYWRRLMWLKEDFKEKERSDVYKIITSLITDFIDKEYEKRYVHDKMTSIISNIKGVDVIKDLREALDKQLQAIEREQK